MSGAMLFGGIFLGLAVLLNFIFIVRKFENGRYPDAITDIAVIMFASSLYGASIMGGVIATIGSMFISIYLNYYPLNLFSWNTGQDSPIKEQTGSVESQDVHKKWADKFDSLFH